MSDDLERKVRAALRAVISETMYPSWFKVIIPTVVRLIEEEREAHRGNCGACDGWHGCCETAEADLTAVRNAYETEVSARLFYQAAIARVRRVLDDELANLADDGARLSHSVVRRIEAALDGPPCP